ncbi:MAG TPA: MYG1 family protein [Acidobacteriota bacterium]|nr:MYG1 family protein [Acidobacteriota bacterium]HQM63868.1 MYG1 family protein [Acidobacteriota bacterium]
MKYAVLHGGPAHRDEFIAVSLWMAARGVLPVFRRDPSPAELADPAVLVVDVGGAHDPARNNYDHHQDRNLPAAFRLVAAALGIDGLARSVYPWWEFASEADTARLEALRSVGLSPGAGRKLADPLGGFLLRRLEEAPGDGPVPEAVIGLMHAFGRDLIGHLAETQERLDLLRERMRVEALPAGLRVMVHDIRDNPALAMGITRDAMADRPAASVTPDDRGDGWALCRFDDDPRIDFAVLAGHPDVAFAHPAGFVAKTRAVPLARALALVRQAVISR